MRHNPSSRYTLLVLFFVFVPFSTCLVALCIADPLSIFHKPWTGDEYYIGGLRTQAAGIIRQKEFDSIILGSSMAANFSIKEASNIWDAHFVNLSAQGSWFPGRSHILKYALKKKNLKNIIISLDGYAKVGEVNPVMAVENYSYLYNGNPFDDIRVYLGPKYRKYIYCRSQMIPESFRCQSVKDLEHIAEWPSMEEELKKFGGVDNWLGQENVALIRKTLFKITQDIYEIRSGTFSEINQKELRKRKREDRDSFDRYIFRYLQENPDTNFFLFFPPYSRMRFALWKQSNGLDFELYLERIRYAVQKVEGTPNGFVFGFGHLDFLDDLKNYKDTSHYHPHYNSEMLKWMYDRQHILTKKNVVSYLQTISHRAKHYNLAPIAEKINLQIFP